MQLHGGWTAYSRTDRHGPAVVPRQDSKAHDVDSVDCACGPFIKDGVLVHQAFDGREAEERRREIN